MTDGKFEFENKDGASEQKQRKCMWIGIGSIIFVVFTMLIIMIVVLATNDDDCDAKYQQWQPDGSCGLYKFATSEHDRVDNYDKEVDKLIAENKIMVFARTDCPWSEKLRELFNDHGLKGKYRLVEIDLEP